MSTNSVESVRWWEHPDRPCKDKEEYADLTMVVGKDRNKRIEAMRQACFECPVLRECREDLLASTKDWQHYGIQAGIRGAS